MPEFRLTFQTPAAAVRTPVVAARPGPDPVAKPAVLKVAKKAIWQMSDDEFDEREEEGGGSLAEYLAYIDGVHAQDRATAIAEAKPDSYKDDLDEDLWPENLK